MSEIKKIKSALISVYHKDNLAEIAKRLHELGVTIYSTGGTKEFLNQLQIPVTAVEDMTAYPSIFGGRVKTLHPRIFGGILYRRDHPGDREESLRYEIPNIDLVIVDLYPFEETVASGAAGEDIIEKIDIGGISLIRAAAKNHRDVLVVPSREEYLPLLDLLCSKNGETSLEDRRWFAARAFAVSSHYDTAIFNYFNRTLHEPVFRSSFTAGKALRYGENPHQNGWFFGDFNALFDQLHGKEISYNNLLDIDAAVSLMEEFGDPAFAILKHNNACGLSVADSLPAAWKKALEGDPVSAYGGVLITNREVDPVTAAEINTLFFEVIIAPGYAPEAMECLTSKKNRIILEKKPTQLPSRQYRTLLNGVVMQDRDLKTEKEEDLTCVTRVKPSPDEINDLLFANRIVKHTKSNAIVLAKNGQLIGSGVGQTSRVDALKQAIEKARTFGFDLNGAVMASDAYFPFSDSVQIAAEAGIHAVIQPGGSVRDGDSVAFCDQAGLAMVFTGIRHFKH